MKEKIIENVIEYVRNGDYYIPNLKVPGGNYNIGKYGRIHAKFIKENRPCFYSMKMIDGKRTHKNPDRAYSEILS